MELQVVCTQVVVIIFGEVQAELGQPGAVDLVETTIVQESVIPAVHGHFVEHPNLVGRSSRSKIGQFKRRLTAKLARAHIHQQVS